jgi:tRNA/tmRNA/rRNA uracil-C5-methylase (TrmA/RlmC/RlmD family)
LLNALLHFQRGKERTVFTKETSRKASKKRTSHFRRITDVAKTARKAKRVNKARVRSTVARANVSFRNNPSSGGANNAMTPTSVEAVLSALSVYRKLSRKCVLVDYGSGSGNVVIAAVLRYGLKAYGIEKDADAYACAQASIKKLKSTEANRIHLFQGDFTEQRFDSLWLSDIGATHIVAFDKAFNLQSGEAMFNTIAEAPYLVGVSTSRPNSNIKLPNKFHVLCTMDKSVAMIGGQKFQMKLWTNGK